ncbi:MAG: amino acid--tRNA ligase-related protein [bacterium]
MYKKVLRPKIIGPAFIYNYPVIMQPLARISDKDTNIVEQFQLLVNGREICKAYSELVDPILQQENFDIQAKAAEAGDEEATASDDDFVIAMEYGMPPQSGFGMGLERLLAIITEQDNLRDVVMFPLMKAEKKLEVEVCDIDI